MTPWILLPVCLLAGGSGYARDSVTLVFQVDMKPAARPVNAGLRGSIPPLSWHTTLPLTDEDGDGIYRGVVRFPEGQSGVLEYKFVYGDKNIVYELEGENRLALLKPAYELPLHIWNVPLPGGAPELPPLQPDKLLEEFNLLKQALLALHPGLYRYNSPAQVDSIFRRYTTVFSRPLTHRQAFLEYTHLTAAFRCGHTWPSFYNQAGFIRQTVLDRADKLPFTFRCIEGKMLVDQWGAAGNALPRGTEITAINGAETAEIFRTLAGLVKADGSNDSTRYAGLNLFGVGPYEMFDVYFPLAYPASESTYTLQYRETPESPVRTAIVQSVSRKQRTDFILEKCPDCPTRYDDWWKLEFWDDNTAYLQLGTFDGFQLGFEWTAFLKDAFQEIRKRKSPNLVIDIRWNDGGKDDMLLALGRQLVASGVTFVPRRDLLRFERVPEEIRPYLFTWDESYFDLRSRVLPAGDGFFTFPEPETYVFKPSGNAYAGKIYLLVNAANSSASFYFAELMRENRIATIIGETTGGSRKGLNGGQMFFLRLPHSNIEIDIPVIGTFSPELPDTGIEPDFRTPESAKSFAEGRDPAIGFVKSLISK